MKIQDAMAAKSIKAVQSRKRIILLKKVKEEDRKNKII
jgi:hypothetical protein